MPRNVQPGGISGQMRVRYTARRKLALLAAAKRIQEEEGVSLRKAAERLMVSQSLLSKWHQQHASSLDEDPILTSLRDKKKKATHLGPLGQLKQHEDMLLRYVFEQREQGVNVDTLRLVVKASSMSPEFNTKSFTARTSAAWRFMRAHSLVYRMGTHVSQRNPEEVRQEATEYMEVMRRIVVGPHRDMRYIINMDQTPVYFAMNAKRTIDVVGVKTVHVRTSPHDTKRATVAVSITGAGSVLPSMVIFKGKPDGRIARNEFSDYPRNHQYRCQDNAWMDEEVMVAWVNDVLKPYVANAPDHVIPLLILDSYRCHMMASVVTRIQDLGVEVRHIPGGCTPLCQPVDVGFNKPFKDRVRRQWLSWMIREGVVHGTTSPPSRRDVAGWIDRAIAEMKGEEQIIKNAWTKTGYQWWDKDGGGDEEEIGEADEVIDEEGEEGIA